MKYYVEAYRTRSLCKTYDVMELYEAPMMFGPWKRLKTAKRKRAELNKDRVVCMKLGDDQYKDYGPFFRKVRIVEVPSE